LKILYILKYIIIMTDILIKIFNNFNILIQTKNEELREILFDDIYKYIEYIKYNNNINNETRKSIYNIIISIYINISNYLYLQL